jgi:hypothetical protein
VAPLEVTTSVRWLLLSILGLSLCLAAPVFAQESSDDTQTTPAPEDQTAPAGPVLQPVDYSPTVCDPSAAGFRYLEVRGSGFDAWARQHLVGNLADANGTPQVLWSSIWVSPQGRLTLEVNLCSDPIQQRPALAPGDYSVWVGDGTGATIAATGISLTAPPEADQGDQTAPALSTTPASNPSAVATSAPFNFVVPTIQAQPSMTPLPVAALVSPTPTPAPRTGLGSLQQPYPLGAPAALVDGWQLLVQGVTPDAYNGIKADVPSAIAPASDQRDFLVRVQATYQGPGTGVFSGVRLALLSSSTQLMYDQIHNACGVIPESLSPNVVTTGTTVRGNVCFTVRASDIGSLVLIDNQASAADKVYFAVQ